MCEIDLDRDNYTSDYSYYLAVINSREEAFNFMSIHQEAKRLATVDNPKALMRALKDLCADGLLAYDYNIGEFSHASRILAR